MTSIDWNHPVEVDPSLCAHHSPEAIQFYCCIAIAIHYAILDKSEVPLERYVSSPEIRIGVASASNNPYSRLSKNLPVKDAEFEIVSIHFHDESSELFPLRIHKQVYAAIKYFNLSLEEFQVMVEMYGWLDFVRNVVGDYKKQVAVVRSDKQSPKSR